MSLPTSELHSETPRHLSGVPREVFTLGVVSFLTDVSSEAIFAVLPLYVTSVLGASAAMLGAMEGFADFASSSLDMASGYLSDRWGKRKSLAVLGYGLSSLSKAVLLVASTVGQVFTFRVVERLGKSIRGAPRDALLSDVAPKETRGVSFGVHKAFDKAGAILGPFLAYMVLDRLGSSAGAFHGLFVFALVPALVSVAVLVLAVRERAGAKAKPVALRETLRSLGPGYRHYLTSAGIFSSAYFSLAFLLLAAARAGFATKHVALLYGLFNTSFTIVSIPIGRLGDRIGRRTIIAASYLLYAVMALGFAVAGSKVAIGVLFVVYGIYLPASLSAGLLWKVFGPQVTFGAAAALALLALVYFVFGEPRRAR